MLGLIIASVAIYVAHYDATHPSSPPQVESFKLTASLPNEFSRVVDITNCNVTSPPPKVEDYINTLPQSVDVLIQNTGNTPLYISSLDMHNNYTGATWTGDVSSVWGISYSTIPTGASQVYGLNVPTTGWNTNGVIDLHFTATTNDGTASGTDLLLRALFTSGNSTTATTTTSSTTVTAISTAVSDSTYSCPLNIPVPHQ